MAFLDNSGDIILDAVLTDTGRFRLARGDGSFKIVKFALSDDEIDYSTYRNANHVDGAHASGSAYYDLEILQTPVLEAFTNNTSMMKSKLMSLSRTNLLYLPILKLNDGDPSGVNVSAPTHTTYRSTPSVGVFLVATDEATEFGFRGDNRGIISGFRPAHWPNHILVEQGLDTEEIPPTTGLDPELVERQYIVEIDSRLGSIVAADGTQAVESFIDDDSVAFYRFAQGSHPAFVSNITNTDAFNQSGTPLIKGPRGTGFTFKIKSSLELQRSDFLFTRFGGTADYSSQTGIGGSDTIKYIDAVVRVTGATTGYRIDIPVRFVKCTTCTTS